MKKSKKDIEKKLVDRIISIGLHKLYEIYGQGRQRNNIYYQIELKDGSMHFWTNFSKESLKIIRDK